MHADDGIRCDNHVGEVFPVRCDDCAAARALSDTALEAAADHFGDAPKMVQIGAECELHRGYILSHSGSCDRCLRDSLDGAL